MPYDSDYSEGWDCDPNAVFDLDESTLDEEDASGDWQEVCLDRFGDRLVRF